MKWLVTFLLPTIFSLPLLENEQENIIKELKIELQLFFHFEVTCWSSLASCTVTKFYCKLLSRHMMILSKEINYMNLPGWNEQPNSDQLSDQNKQLRNHYRTVLRLHNGDIEGCNDPVFIIVNYDSEKLPNFHFQAKFR